MEEKAGGSGTYDHTSLGVATELASALAELCIAANKNAQTNFPLLPDETLHSQSTSALKQAVASVFVSDTRRAVDVAQKLTMELNSLRFRVQNQATAVETLQREITQAALPEEPSGKDDPSVAHSAEKYSPSSGHEALSKKGPADAKVGKWESVPKTPLDIPSSTKQAALHASKHAYVDLVSQIGETSARVGSSAAAAAFSAGVEHHKAELQAAEAKRNEAMAMKIIAGSPANVKLDAERTRILRDKPDVTMVLPLRVWVTELQKEMMQLQETSADAATTSRKEARHMAEGNAKLATELRHTHAEATRQYAAHQARLKDYTRMQLENERLKNESAKAIKDRQNMAKNANFSERKKAEAKADALHARNGEILTTLRKLKSENENMASQRRSHLDRLTSQQKMLDEMRQLMAMAFDMKDTHQGSSFKLRVQSIQPEEVAALLSQYSSRAADVVASNREIRELKARLLKSQEQFDTLKEQLSRAESALQSKNMQLANTCQELNTSKQHIRAMQKGQTRPLQSTGKTGRPRSAQIRRHLEESFGHVQLPSTPIRPSSAAAASQSHSTRPSSAALLAARDAKQVIKSSSSLDLDTSQFASTLALATERDKAQNPFSAGAADILPSPKPSKEVTLKLLASPGLDHTTGDRSRLGSSSPERRASRILDTSYALSDAASGSLQWRFNKLLKGPGNKALHSQIAAERLDERLEGLVPDADAPRFHFDPEAEGRALAESIRGKATQTMKSKPRMKMTGRFESTGLHRGSASPQHAQSAEEKMTRAAAKRAHFMDTVNEQLGQAVGRKSDASAVSTVVQGKMRAHTQFRIRKFKHGQDNSMKNIPKAERPSAVALKVAQNGLSLLERSGKTASAEYHKHMTADVRSHLLHDSGAVSASDLETQIRESKMRLNVKA